MSETRDRGSRSGRINLRVEPETHELLRSAAHLQHTSLSAFLLGSAVERAHQIVDEERRLVLRVEEFERVLDQLDRPAQVVAPLVRLAERVARQFEVDRETASPQSS